MWVIHGFFIFVMYEFFYFKMEAWKPDVYRVLGLSFEMNYAVWWSGISLFLASLIYFRLAQVDDSLRKSWIVLGIVTLALCCDEIGSLHETVAAAGGWLGLLPFAIILGTGYFWALYNLLKNTRYRATAYLIFLGVAIFVGVAGMEFIEHNIDLGKNAQRFRLVAEEGIELVAIGLLVTSGLMAYLRSSNIANEHKDIRLSSIASVLVPGFNMPHIMFIIFAIQLSVVILFILPDFSLFPFSTGEGNLTALYPVLLFICLGLFCLNQSLKKTDRFWQILGYLFISTSIIQLYNLNEFINALINISGQSNWDVLQNPPTSWSMILIIWVATVIFCKTRSNITLRTIAAHLGVLIILMALLIPGAENLQLADGYYFLFSSCVGYSCYQFLFEANLTNEY